MKIKNLIGIVTVLSVSLAGSMCMARDSGMTVAVATTNLQSGAVLATNNIAQGFVKDANLPDDFITGQDMKVLLGVKLAKPVKKGEPIKKSDLDNPPKAVQSSKPKVFDLTIE